MKQDLYDTLFSLYDVDSNATDVNGDQTVDKTLVGIYECQIDNLNGDDAIRYGRKNELATHVIFCDVIDGVDTQQEIVSQEMQLDISIVVKNLGGLTSLTRGLEIYCIFREWVPTENQSSSSTG